MNRTNTLWGLAAPTAMASLLTFSLSIPSPQARPTNTISAEVTRNATDSISGTIIDHATNQPVTGAEVVLEEPDRDGIDRVLATTRTAPGGFFIFTGLQEGRYYDVVADASLTSSSGTVQTYAATVTFAVPVGRMLVRAPLVPEFGDSAPNGEPARASATVTTSTSAATPTEADVKLSALESAPLENGSTMQVTIPVFSGSTPRVTTSPNPDCLSGTSCASYVLFVPSSSPVYGTFHLSGTSYTVPPAEPAEVVFHIDGKAFLPGTNTPDCSPSTQTSGQVVPRGTLVSTIPNLAFSGCQ